MQIHGCVVLVTGANRGLGQAFIKALQDAGASKIYAAARNPETVTPAHGVIPIKLDITNPEDILNAVAECKDINILINNAGISLYSSNLFDPNSLTNLRKEIETNVFGTFALIQAFASVLAANGGGAVLNVLSALSWVSLKGAETYSASKSAIWSLTNGLRHVLAEQGTQLVGLHVGFMDTDMTKELSVAKADPLDVARQALLGIENGESEVLADTTSIEIKQALSMGIYLRSISRS